MDELQFKFIMRRAVIDPRSTAYHLIENIDTVNSNIKTFNHNLKLNMEGLKSRGYITDYRMTNLFKAYHVS